MKVWLLLVFLVGVTVVQGAVIYNYTIQCARESGISRGALKSIENLRAPSSDDEAYKNFMLCLLKRMGVLTDEGEIRSDADGVKKWMPEDEANKAVEEIKRICGTQKGKTQTDTADLVYRCILDNDL